MKYFRNTELAKLYGVSEKSVRNWIQAAQTEKIDLQLYEHNSKWFVANTSKNTAVIEELVAKGKKYKNTRSVKHVVPSSELYKICDEKQLYNLISELDIHREIPHQYSYLSQGADHWDKYTYKLLGEKLPNSLTNTIRLLDLSEEYLRSLVQNYSGINIIDLGVGNCLPVRKLLTNLKDMHLLKRYVGIDTSPDMLAIAEANINTWFGRSVNFESNLRDISYDRFGDLVVADSFDNHRDHVANIVLFLGGTISNLRDPDQALLTIKNSMGRNDMLIITRKLDTPESRRFFDFTVTEEQELSLKERYMLDLLGIEQAFYSVEQFFDKSTMSRKIQVRLRVDLTIKFTLNGKTRIVSISKGDSILLWRSDHQTLDETVQQLDRTGFEVLQAAKSPDRQYSLYISRIKTAA